MAGCGEHPGKGSELPGTGCLSGQSVPSWLLLLGHPPRLEVDPLDVALGPPLLQTLGPVDALQAHVWGPPPVPSHTESVRTQFR